MAAQASSPRSCRDAWPSQPRTFRHEAFLYNDSDDFIEGVTGFVADGLIRGEPAVIAVSRDKIEVLRSALGGDQAGVVFVDMDDVGRNPAFRNHPVLLERGCRRPSPTYRAPPPSGPPGGPLPESPEGIQQLALMAGGLREVQHFVSDHTNAIGLSPDRVSDLVVAVTEVVTNTLRHATGGGVLRIWAEGHRVLAEVEDQGRIADPLIGRHPPSDVGRGRGLRIVNQLCDLVQVRSGPRGTTVRLQMALTE